MIRVHEVYETKEVELDIAINNWLINNPRIGLIDIKYIVIYDSTFDQSRSHALIIYTTAPGD